MTGQTAYRALLACTVLPTLIPSVHHATLAQNRSPTRLAASTALQAATPKMVAHVHHAQLEQSAGLENQRATRVQLAQNPVPARLSAQPARMESTVLPARHAMFATLERRCAW